MIYSNYKFGPEDFSLSILVVFAFKETCFLQFILFYSLKYNFGTPILLNFDFVLFFYFSSIPNIFI